MAEGGGGWRPPLLVRVGEESPPLGGRLEELRMAGVGGGDLGLGCRMEVDHRGHAVEVAAGGWPCPPEGSGAVMNSGMGLPAAMVDDAMMAETEQVHGAEVGDVMGVGLHGSALGGRKVEVDPLVKGANFWEAGSVGRGEVADLMDNLEHGRVHVGVENAARAGQFAVENSPVGSGSEACTSSVRRNAPAWGHSWGGLNSTSESSGSPRMVWGRPAVVPLPSPAELGEVRGGPDRVWLEAEEVNVIMQKFEAALVGRLFGRRIPFAILNRELQRQWQGYGPFRLVTVGGDSFICFFNSVEGRNAVLMGGPWFVAGQVVGIDRWSPDFSPSSKSGFVTPIWVRLPDLPFYCWGGRSLARIAGRLGEPIGMDVATDKLERGQFARVCIRMDLSQALKPGIWIEGPFGSFFQKVIYEGLSAFCFRCGHVGHKVSQCQAAGDGSSVEGMAGCVVGQPMAGASRCEVEQGGRAGERDEPTEEVVRHPITKGVTDGVASVGETSGFGPWMVVQRRKKQNRVPKGGGTGNVYKGFTQPAEPGRSGSVPGGHQQGVSRPKWLPSRSGEANFKAMNGIGEKGKGPTSSLQIVEYHGEDMENGDDHFTGFKAMPDDGGSPDKAVFGSKYKKRKQAIQLGGGVASPLGDQ